MWWWLSFAFAADPWQGRVDVAVAELRDARPELCEAVLDAVPMRTRAGTLRYLDDRLADPAAAPLLLERLGARDLAPELRYAYADALVRALPQGDGRWYDAWLGLLEADPDPLVRQVLVAGLRRAPREVALAGLAVAHRDSDVVVRETADELARWVR